MNTEKLCQSCGMPLINDGNDLRGSEKNGEKSIKFCLHCYRNSAYIEPHITFEQMVQRGIEMVNSSKGNFFQKFLMRKSYPTLLRQLERWQ